MGEIQKAYNVLAGILRRDADEAYDTAEKLKEGPLQMAKDHEWDSFCTNNNQMVDPRQPVRQVSHVTYPGKEHPAAIEVRSGMLERKSKYLKNYTPGWYVSTLCHGRSAHMEPGTFFLLLISTNLNQPIRSLSSRLSCRFTYQSRNWALIPSLARHHTNSC